MNYEQFLELYQGEDSELAREAYTNMISQFRQENFGSGGKINISNLGLGTDSASAINPWDRGVHGRLGPEGGKVFYDHPALHDKISPTGPAGDYRLPIKSGGEAFEQEGRNYLVAQDRFYNRDNWNQLPQQSPVASAPYSRPHVTQDSFNIPSTYQGPAEGLLGPTGTIGPQDSFAVSADSSLYGGNEAALAQAAADSATTDSATGLSGPQAFAANMALNMIPTRDRKKMNTPLGDEGSFSGITKGAGKGALVGSTFGPQGALIGGTIGALAGTQGYFDSETPPAVQIMRIKQRGGSMPRGLLGGMYA